MLKPISMTLLFILPQILSQNPSPCPEIFSYEPRGQEEDRWYGVISLQSDEELDGVWLKILLDRPAELLGNWLGEAVSSDKQEFTIRNNKYKLEAGPPVSVRFFVKYNPASTIPSLKTIKLNGKTICPSSRGETGANGPQLHISQITPSRPNNRPISSSEGAFLNNRESTTTTRTTSHQRPSNTFGGSSQERPSNNNRGTSSSGNNYHSGGDSSEERPNNYNNHQTNNGHSSQSTNRRPSGNGHSNSLSNNGQREHESSNTGTNSKGLSADEEPTHDSDFFPGDFAVHRPSQVRPPSKPSTLSKRNVACGTVAMKASPLISYGQNTTQGQWPWHAALYHAQGAQLMYTCGATLISENHILTAAHCVAKPQTNRPIDTRNLAVYLGKYSLKKFGSGTQDREVSDIFIHPQYNYSVYFNDIAVLKLKSPADITNYVRPCCLWEDGTDIEYVLNKYGTVVGWGFDEKRQISDTLMQAQMPIVSTVDCIYSNREFFSQFTFEKTYCAGFRNGTTVCNGDSGGGMVFPKAGTSGHNTVWQVRGIVSVGVALQGQGVCDPRHYIVFTDVAKHLDWIKQVMNE